MAGLCGRCLAGTLRHWCNVQFKKEPIATPSVTIGIDFDRNSMYEKHCIILSKMWLGEEVMAWARLGTRFVCAPQVGLKHGPYELLKTRAIATIASRNAEHVAKWFFSISICSRAVLEALPC